MSKSDHDAFTEQRQQWIISAAEACFSRAGFHGTSMADICRESGLGAGQIYRHFSSKESIVWAAINAIAVRWRLFLQHTLPQQNSVEHLVDPHSTFWHGWPQQDRCLLLEMYSEASRNEAVREVLAQQEQQLVRELSHAFALTYPVMSAEQRHQRIQFLLVLVDGVACRAVDDGDKDAQERRRINAILDRHLFT
ncbi:TetR/AcrR family transcriptional regulator [Pantoea sp. Mb-10]|uniref:TetR/AcrR family transcriptional regulator n=1 Tax=unclassified Pantoea TaxID=2630326 RepID=UPI001E4F85C4|nr:MULTISPECIES: TetR/AcrR family transcriptional regulator [unclassified Pantoea]MCE0492098.1 TetR/AcrR family transcriptional regulator [Pantoea sp. Mb-10]MCE0502474.1 TetR/AcrR family transcriptional regulator [Pantoea sp. Pb-8]